jgi:AcrR family transcriptional regulator
MNPAERTLRVDAARNRDLLLAAAEEAFADKGLDVSTADIARRAGVAKGTFFRHFTTKDDLIAAVVKRNVEALVTVAEGLLEASDPGDALLEFLTVVAAQRQQQDVSFLLRAGESDARVAEVRDRLYSAIVALVDRASDAGAIRHDIGATDVILLMCAPNHVVEQLPEPDPDLWRRYLAIIFDGLRPEGAHPLPQREPETAH